MLVCNSLHAFSRTKASGLGLLLTSSIGAFGHNADQPSKSDNFYGLCVQCYWFCSVFSRYREAFPLKSLLFIAI